MQKLSSLTAGTTFLLLGLIATAHGQTQPPAAAPAAPADPAAPQTPPADQPPAPPPVQRSEEAHAAIAEARNRLFSHTSVQANIREFVSLGDRKFEAEGSYVAGPFDPLPKLRLEYRVRVGRTEGILLEVCDGQLLRTQRSIQRLDAPATAASESAAPRIQVTRRDVGKILQAIHQNGGTPQAILQAELGLGGLPALLASLERAMVFESVQVQRVGSRDYQVVQGRWNPAFVADFRNQFKQFGRDADAYLPEFVRVYLDPETLFPVRIVYWRPGNGEAAAPIPMLTLEFSDIRLNAPVSPSAFEYVRPANVDEEDVTERFIQAIQAAGNAGAAPAP